MDVFGEIPTTFVLSSKPQAKTAATVKRKHLRKIITDVHNEIVQNTGRVAVPGASAGEKKGTKKNWRFAYDMYCKEIMLNHTV